MTQQPGAPMSVSLTFALPDLQPDTIRAAFAALLPPPPAEPVAPAMLLDLQPPAEPEHALVRAARMVVAFGMTDGTGIEVHWDGVPRITLTERDFRSLCAGETAHTLYGLWTVERGDTRLSCYLGGDENGAHVVAPNPAPMPEVEVEVGPPPAAPELPTKWDDDVPF